MEQNEEINTNNQILQLIKYYEKNELQIISFNDKKENRTFSKKGILEHLKEQLTTKDFTPNIINTSSLLINNPTYIDYFLENNLSIEEIKIAQNYNTLEILETLKTFKTNYLIKNNDNQLFITVIIKKSIEPIIIYSLDIYNLINIFSTNEFDQIIERIKLNFENILSINKEAEIYVISSKINVNEENQLKKIKEKYNNKLKELCLLYNLSYIDINTITQPNNLKIAQTIIENIYKNKIIHNKKQKQYIEGNLFITNYGPKGILEILNLDYKKDLISEKEYLTKEKILKKVIKKSTTKRNNPYYNPY